MIVENVNYPDLADGASCFSHLNLPSRPHSQPHGRVVVQMSTGVTSARPEPIGKLIRMRPYKGFGSHPPAHAGRLLAEGGKSFLGCSHGPYSKSRRTAFFSGQASVDDFHAGLPFSRWKLLKLTEKHSIDVLRTIGSFSQELITDLNDPVGFTGHGGNTLQV